MNVYADLVEDFSQALAELQGVLAVKIPQNDKNYSSLVHDAQIFSFLRASQLVRSLLMALHQENAVEFYPSSEDGALVYLCMNDVIDDDQVDQIGLMLEVAEFMVVDRAWIDTEDDQRQFDAGICQFPSFYRAMNLFLHDVTSRCELIERQEESYEGH